MSICLFPHVGYLSETSRMIAVYKELKKLGKDVIMATHGGTYESILKEEKIEYFRVDPEMTIDQCRAFVLSNTVDGKWGSFYTPEELEGFVSGEIKFFKENNIKLVLTGFNLSLGLSARKAGCIYCVTHLGSWSPLIFEKQMQTPFNYLEHKVPSFISRKWMKKMVNRIYLKGKILIGPFNKAARKLKIEPLHSTFDMFMGDYTFVTECPEILEIPKEELESWTPRFPAMFHKNPRLRYTGPVYAKLFGELEDDVKDFLKTDKPKIYIALTSSRGVYVKALLKVLSALDARIITVTTVHDIDSIGNGNILVRSHLPSHKVMPLVDLAIIHGGQGSVQTAVASGTPIIGFPLQTEQHFNLNLIENKGAGINYPLQYLEYPQRIRTAVNHVLTDPSYKESMMALKAIQDMYDGPAEVARQIVELV